MRLRETIQRAAKQNVLQSAFWNEVKILKKTFYKRSRELLTGWSGHQI